MSAGERVLWTAKRWLGLKAVVSKDRVEGRPVVEFHGHRLSYRIHPVDGRYFRLIVPCAECGKETVSHTHQIRNRHDMTIALENPPPVPILCPRCAWRDDVPKTFESVGFPEI